MEDALVPFPAARMAVLRVCRHSTHKIRLFANRLRLTSGQFSAHHKTPSTAANGSGTSDSPIICLRLISMVRVIAANGTS